MLEIREVSLQEVLWYIDERKNYHQEQMEYANSFSRSNYGARLAWCGHKKCFDGLQNTREAIFAGNPCNRSIARMFGKGARLQKDFEHLAELYLHPRPQRADEPPF
jgi:hypothetical protein